jgi:hypothetical protein
VTARLYQRWHDEGARVFLGEPLASSGEFKRLSIELLLAWSAEWGRSDLRLLEIILDWLWINWKKVHPSKLNEIVLHMPTPAVWGVLREWTELRGKEMGQMQTAFWNMVTDGIKREAGRLFLSEGKLHRYSDSKKQIQRNLLLYKKWGFIGTELPQISAWKKISPFPTREERMGILKDLGSRGEFQLEDYMNALDQRVSRQSAWRDLEAADFLNKRGKTKGRIYKLKIGQ